MIAALRFQPSDFEYAHGWLNHVPSRHRFQFDRKGRVTIDALCGCAAMSVRPEQADELHSMFKTWRQHYWTPMEQNREFASHFKEPTGWVRLFRDIGRIVERSIPRPVPVFSGAGGAFREIPAAPIASWGLPFARFRRVSSCRKIRLSP
jgi:hypothetical protein